MTINTIVSSIIHAVVKAIEIKRQNADPMEASSTNWRNEAHAILTGLPVAPNVNLADWLSLQKQYDTTDIEAAGAAISIIEAGSNLYDAIVDGGNLTPYTGGEAPDQEIVDYILSKLEINLQPAPQTAQPVATAVDPANQITIDPGMENAINALLNQATGGKIANLKAVLAERDGYKNELLSARTDLANSINRERNAAVPTTGTEVTAMGDLTFDVVYEKASDIFLFNGVKSKALNFDIPTLVWKDSQGNVVSHPEVPKIDPHYDLDALKVLQFLTAMNRNMNPWLFGHTGTGKTTFVEQIAAKMGWPVSRINLDANLERADLVGHITLAEQNGTTISTYEEGILPRAMQRPGFLIIDEIDSGRPDILFVIQRALEGNGLMLTEDKGRVVAPHPLFRFAATANTRGQGDEYGMYAGTRSMNASMIDRFTAFIEFQYMKPDRESKLLQARVPSLLPAMADKMAQFAKEIRAAFNKGDISNTISPRGLTVLADTYATFTSLGTKDDAAFNIAVNMAILNKATNDTRQKFIELASRVFNFQIKADAS